MFIPTIMGQVNKRRFEKHLENVILRVNFEHLYINLDWNTFNNFA
jgi:hypothetical protein